MIFYFFSAITTVSTHQGQRYKKGNLKEQST